MAVLLIQRITVPDSLGRCHFSAWWWTNNIGPACDEYGWRGQNFFMEVDRFVARKVYADVQVVEVTQDTIEEVKRLHAPA